MSVLNEISAAFVAARREGRALSDFPGEVPKSAEAAYAVQHASIRSWGDTIAGYKVGGVAPAFADDFPGRRLAGPVFSKLVQTVTLDGHVEVPVFVGGFAAYEAEFIMVLENLDQLSGEITDFEAAKPFVTSLHIGAEIASSPLVTLNDLGPGSIISDFGNQAGIVVGPEIDRDYLNRIQDIEVVLDIDGVEIGRAHPNPGEGGPLDALRFLLNHIQTLPQDIVLPERLFLSSGAITGVHQSTAGTTSKITFGDLGAFTIHMSAQSVLNT
jgi:2-keto-4-pentenoate hydratase